MKTYVILVAFEPEDRCLYGARALHSRSPRFKTRLSFSFSSVHCGIHGEEENASLKGLTCSRKPSSNRAEGCARYNEQHQSMALKQDLGTTERHKANKVSENFDER